MRIRKEEEEKKRYLALSDREKVTFKTSLVYVYTCIYYTPV